MLSLKSSETNGKFDIDTTGDRTNPPTPLTEDSPLWAVFIAPVHSLCWS